MKRFLKRLFCKHDFEYCEYVGYQNAQPPHCVTCPACETMYVYECKKCGKHQPSKG